MKNSSLLMFCLVAPVLTTAAERVGSCQVGGKLSSRVDAVRSSKIADTYVYSLRLHGGMRPFFGDKESSRGSSVEIHCAGQRNRALVVSGEFTSNFLQGFVLARNPKNGAIERFDFAEKNRPIRLYLTSLDAKIVIPTYGYGETNKKFVVYHHAFGAAGEAEVASTDELPLQADAEVIQLSAGP